MEEQNRSDEEVQRVDLRMQAAIHTHANSATHTHDYSATHTHTYSATNSEAKPVVALTVPYTAIGATPVGVRIRGERGRGKGCKRRAKQHRV